MKTYYVDLPVSGRVAVEVEADSEEEAIDKALNSYSIDNLEEWSAERHLVQGNIFYGVLAEARAQLADGDKES